MYHAMKSEFYWQNWKWREQEPGEEKEKFQVFDALIAFDMSVLIEENGMPKCQYLQLLRWRNLIVELEEDLFITSYLAYKDTFSSRERTNFFWNPVIGHNNRELNNLLKAGVAENHFHLKGSAPHFHLSWISMMNDVKNERFYEVFNAYDNYRLSSNVSYDSFYQNDSLCCLWLQAVLIRVFLFCMLKDTYLELEDYYVTKTDISESVREGEKSIIEELLGKNNSWEQGRISLNELQKAYKELAGTSGEIGNDTLHRLRKRGSAHWVSDRLENVQGLEEYKICIQNNIERLKENYRQSEYDYDYCLCREYLIHNKNKGVNEVISGERWFMYQVFCKFFKKETSDEFLMFGNWFYLYLVIKANIRKELVQANINVGFDNFRLYQDRKEQFIEETKFEEIYLKMAVRDTIYNQHITTLEARVAPKNTKEKLEEAIGKYDAGVLYGLEDQREKEELRNKFFYVVHFIKKTEHYPKTNQINERKCRHEEKRIEVQQQAKAIADLRDSGSEYATRIHGIDASASEIWCRPEVFAQAFRYLKNHMVSYKQQILRDRPCCQLLATYHVGEDFLDIIDGLRAIDEAIHFLNLQCGDRLGHALALGVNIDEWYEGKANRLLINKMGYLDNLVWLYAKIRKYNIEDCGAALEYIQKRYHQYFAEIYRNNMSDQEIAEIVKKARDYFANRDSSICGYNYVNMDWNIDTYYDSWKLRGDDPELYREGFLKIEGKVLDHWDEYALNRIYPDNYRIRYQPEVALLYHMYHYNDRVKMEGDQMIDVKVQPAIREAVKKVRKEMQKEISSIGIGIETNPSSNYLIGTFRRYDKHPIMEWYNLGLVNDPEKLESCPQLDVSVNTDDQGVFSTYIENEYAYMALALEKCKDADGNRVYNKTMILQWLDNVRKSGISQSFVWED